ncbi:MAG TPA: response regulator transcription factor [Pelobium sp.]
MKVLIVEDEVELAASMRSYLQNQNYDCEVAYDVEEAEEKISRHNFQIIILDIMLPLASGMSLLRNLHLPKKNFTVIVVSAKNSDDDRQNSFAFGADDYLVKPFHLAELSARIQAARNNKSKKPAIITHKNLKVNALTNTVSVDDKEIELNKTEISILLLLIANRNRVVSNYAIAENLNAKSTLYFNNFDAVGSLVNHLKIKLGRFGEYIEPIFTTGFKLN